MKKLIIVAAIVCAAAVSQAATISWAANNKSLTDETGAILRDASALENIVLVNLGSTADFSSVTASQIIPTSSDTSVSPRTTMTLNTATNSKGGRLSGTVTFTYDGAGSVIDNGDYLALMFYDGKDFAQLKYTDGGADVDAVYQVSGLANNASALSGKSIAMTGNFYAAAVPEPTSALLMLLGVAGLALRRRHA